MSKQKNLVRNYFSMGDIHMIWYPIMLLQCVEIITPFMLIYNNASNSYTIHTVELMISVSLAYASVWEGPKEESFKLGFDTYSK